MMAALDRLFHLTANGTTVRTEILAGVTTFLTMVYIIFVQPAVLSGTLFGIQTGMDFGAVMTATCVSAVVCLILLMLYARYPIIKVLSGRIRDIRWPMVVVCLILLMYFVMIRS